MDEFLRLVEQADLVIAHAGAGTLLNVLRAGKVPVVMPRRKRYGEHVDDHQMELVEALGSTGWVIPALEPRDLPSAIAEARCRPRTVPGRGRSQMLSLIGVAIQQLLDNRK
jgi:UDP-N-acetylglucosamine transferase subunit ALG13